MPEYVRVKDKSTGHKFTAIKSAVDADPDAYQVLKQDAVDHNDQPLAPEYASDSPAPTGQQATTEKEKS